MRILNIGSGSGGNATYIGTENTHILIDAGLSRKRITEGLREADLSLDDLDAIFVTHEHIDHISGLGVIERTREIPVYATEGTLAGISACNSLGQYNKEVLCAITPDCPFTVGDLRVLPLRTDHDANCPVCYRIETERQSAAVVTDLGEPNLYLEEHLQGLDLLMLESNHDIRMLEVGPYPYSLKLRIMGQYGHLSNETAGVFLTKLLHDRMKHILLGHISKENNTHELAKIAVENEVNVSDTAYKAGDFDIRTLSQHTWSELIVI